MPTLILRPRYTVDSIKFWKNAIALNWEVERLQSWRINSEKEIDNPVIYGEPLFAKTIAEHLSIELLEPDLDWLTTLSKNYVKRNIIFTTIH